MVLMLDTAELQGHADVKNWSILWLIIYMKKFLQSDWQRACQLILNYAENWNLVQNVENEWKKVEIRNDWQASPKPLPKQNGR